MPTGMTPPVRPRRSVLFMPGSNARALEKARTLPADAVIFDLEDAVAPAAKELARRQVIASVRAGGYGRRELIVRVNGLGAPWGRAELAGVAGSGADAVLLPKVESPETADLAKDLHARHTRDRVPPGRRARLRRQDAHPPQDHRQGERDLCAHGRRHRLGPAGHRRPHGGRGPGARCRAPRRPADREPARGGRAANGDAR